MIGNEAAYRSQRDGMPWIDAALALLAFVLAYIARYEFQIVRPVLEINTTSFGPYLPYMLMYVVWLALQYRGSGLYRYTRGRPYMQEVYTIINGVTNATVIVMAVSFVAQPLFFSRLMMVMAAIITVILLALARVVVRIIEARQRARGIGVERVLIIGAKDVGRAVLRSMAARKDLGYVPVGYLDDDPVVGNTDLGRYKGLGNYEQLAKVIKAQKVDLVIVTLTWAHHDLIMHMIETAQQAGASVRVVPDLFQLNLRQVQVENLDGIPLLGINSSFKLRGSDRFAKRIMDMILMLLVAPLALIVFGLVALAVRMSGPGPIIYAQERVGENGKRFTMYKFRSMIPDADKYQQEMIAKYGQDPLHPKFKDDWRVTPVGRFIRNTSLDELPNLLNILRGQMSWVGPRPPTPDEVAKYKPWHMQRLKTMPGLTGLWQVSGRSDVPFDEMCLLDIYYIENWSVSFDVQILMMTIPRVLLREGAY